MILGMGIWKIAEKFWTVRKIYLSSYLDWLCNQGVGTVLANRRKSKNNVLPDSSFPKPSSVVGNPVASNHSDYVYYQKNGCFAFCYAGFPTTEDGFGNDKCCFDTNFRLYLPKENYK
jgi:hypothetical protein